ncbi:MAG TPA: multidrug effflux MFS transporter [Acidimicrobiia bacterium]|nr:multidrug effflux MFS transporter [Acidimicrobiia bacterium]
MSTGLRRSELVGLLSMTMALTALSIDLMLPAFGEIRAAFAIDPDSSQAAALVTSFMVGLGIVQVVYGPFSDRFGRKPVIYVGFAVFAAGALGSALAPSFGLLLLSRFVWGLGAAGPRVITLAIVRDTHRGDEMAKVMSLLMAVFILVPVFAPGIGAVIVSVAPWRAIFWFCVAYVGVCALWMLRLPETLDPRHRIELRFDGVRRAALTVIRHRAAMAYAAAIMVMFGVFVSYLATSELFIDDVFDLGDRFPLIFGVFAAGMGVAVLSNISIVGRFGARSVVRVGLVGYVATASALVGVAMASGGRPSFWVFGPLLGVMLGMHALLVPNMNALAMEPMGTVAGTASALIGTAQTGGGALLGSIVDRAYDGTVRPLAVAFMVSGTVVAALFAVAGRLSPATTPVGGRTGPA